MGTDLSVNIYLIEHCDFSYRGNRCLKDINLRFQQGRMYGLIGPNGSGKTTLINLLTGSAPPSAGTVLLKGQSIRTYSKADLARLLSFVPQTFSMDFEYTVSEVVMMGRHPYIGRFGSPCARDHQLVNDALATLDIHHLQNRFVTRLSGGERQRVLVARALAQDTEIIVLDEATASLDVRHSIDIMKALRSKVDDTGATAIAAIHDLDLAASFCDELIVMHNGSVHSSGKVHTQLTAQLLKNIFGVDATILNTAGNNPHIHYQYNNA